MMIRMKLSIDPDACTGCEDCTQTCPSLFKMGNNWIAEVVHPEVPGELQEQARDTAKLCQFEAIRIED